MRIAVLGTTPMTEMCITEFLGNGWEVAAVVSMPKDKCPLNSINLKEVSDAVGAVYYETDDLNGDGAERFLRDLGLDYIFSPWPYIIKENILGIPKYLVIGSHPTQLPHNKGRHPLHWLISQGIKESCMSFFAMDSGVDSGNILIQEKFSCVYELGIQDVYRNMLEACRHAIGRLCKLLQQDPMYRGVEQNSAEGNYWRKRNIFDVMIDFRMKAQDIVQLVKSFNEPYECAVLLYNNHMVRIKDAEIAPYLGEREEIQRLEPGKIISIESGCIKVKTADEIIQLETKEPEEMGDVGFGKYIYPPAKYIIDHPGLYQMILEKQNAKAFWLIREKEN